MTVANLEVKIVTKEGDKLGILKIEFTEHEMKRAVFEERLTPYPEV